MWGSLTVPDYERNEYSEEEEQEKKKEACRSNLRLTASNKFLQTHETLVTLRVVVLETDLELDSLDEVTLLTDSGSLSLEGRLVEDGLDHGSHA